MNFRLKIASRKFIAWGVWTVLIAVSFVLAKEAVPLIIPWYGGITLVYIGGQAVIDGLKNKWE